MSTTTNLGLFKHDNPATNTDPFDLQKSINDNLDKIDAGIGSDRTRISKNETDITEIKAKNTVQDTNIATLTQRLTEKDNQIAELEDKVSDLNNNQICGKASGEYVHLSDSAKMNCDIAVLGNSKQETREGYNLFNKDEVTRIATYYGSISYVDSILTTPAFKPYNWIKFFTSITLSPGTYYFSFKVKLKSGTCEKFNRISFNNDVSDVTETVLKFVSNAVSSTYQNIKAKIDVTDTLDIQNIFINVPTGTSDAVLEITDVMLSNKDAEYEQYGAMPSINYPSEIETVGNNVNLLQNFATSQTIDGVTFTVNKDGTVVANGTAPTSKNVTFVINNKQLSLPAGEYALSGCPSTYVKKRICRIDIWKSDWSFLCSEQGDGGRMTLSEDIENLIVGVTIFKGETANNLVFKPKIEKGTVATAYSLYGIGSENVKVYNRNLLNTPYNSENKLTDTATSDGYYITTGFKAYLIAGKTYHFKCETSLKFGFASDGGEGLCYLMLNKQANTFFQLLSNDRTITVKESGWYYLRYDIYKANKTASFWNFQLEEGITSTDYIAHEEQNYTVDMQEEMLEGDYFDLENGKEVHNWQKIESYNDEEITTEYKSTTGELSSGATIYYKLSEPRKLDLTENQKAQLQALKKAKTYKNITNITTDTIAVLDVDYKRDLETYQKQQDDRITAIEQLLSTTATSAMLLDNVQSDLESEVK